MTLTTQNNQMHFSFPDVHPDAKVTIEFQRTLRIPDDGKNHKLPPGLGTFPLKHVDDHADRVPLDWQKRGGLMIPLFQSEALWINFRPSYLSSRRGISSYPFAIKIAAGMMSAVTGDKWRKKLHKDDYVTVPKQPYIDGFVVEKGIIKQFIAMPLGDGFSVEEQLTGKAEFGGIQIAVVPMKRKVFERRFPKPVERKTSARFRRRSRAGGSSAQNYSSNTIGSSFDKDAFYSPQLDTRSLEIHDSAPAAPAADMGMGAGGSMKQDIYPDPYGIEDWKKKDLDGNRCFVHLANTIAWQAITGEVPPHKPPTAAEYTRHGYPWFDYYDDEKGVKATKKLKGVKSVLELGFQKGVAGLIENESLPKKPNVVNVGPDKRPKKKDKGKKRGAVRDGSWAT